MPNITVRLDDSMFRQARIWAAVHNTTITEVVREFLHFLACDNIDSLEPREAVPAGLLEKFSKGLNSHGTLPFRKRN